MEQPPGANRCRQNQQPEHLIAPEHAPLLVAPGLLGLLLCIRLDARLNHRSYPQGLANFNGTSRPSIGERLHNQLGQPR